MIRVFPRKTNATPDDVNVYIGKPTKRNKGYGQEVFISCTFTWDKSRCEELAELWKKAGYIPVLGGPAYGDEGSEFIAGRYVKQGYTITSRGCNNRCWFCYVWKREGRLRELPIVEGWNVLDSNLLQCSEKHIREVFAMLKQQPEKAVFTGGLEAKILQDWHMDLLVGLKPKRFYFAYDTPDDYEPLVRASKLIKEAGFKYWHVSCYVLIGHPKDTFELAEARLTQVCKLGLFPMAMLYRGDDGEYKREWRQYQREWARPIIVGSKLRKILKGE